MSQYTAEDIEVLTGLEPVRKRPGMYTDTARPNHLAQEVIDNSVDEALAGHCKKIEVTIYKDGSLELSDDGRGMPVDKHPKEKIPGVELILTRLHAGGKFSSKNYQFSGGLHGVGVSVVNALSEWLDLNIWRDGKEHHMRFRFGDAMPESHDLGAGESMTAQRCDGLRGARLSDAIRVHQTGQLAVHFRRLAGQQFFEVADVGGGRRPASPGRQVLLFPATGSASSAVSPVTSRRGAGCEANGRKV